MNTLDVVWNTDLVTLCDLLEPQSVDMILADVPYGTTACAWDDVIPFAPMWAGFKRVIKPRGAIVMTASQPFTSRLIVSNLEMFKHTWVWDKAILGNFLNLQIQPAEIHEDICIFADGKILYYPQMTKGKARIKGNTHGKPQNVGAIVRVARFSDEYHPKSILRFSNGDRTSSLHPTQKPVALFEYLIRTYTQPGDVVLDPTCGSGTTAIAARNTGRHFICGDLEPKYVDVARKRLSQDYTLPMFETLGVSA